MAHHWRGQGDSNDCQPDCPDVENTNQTAQKQITRFAKFSKLIKFHFQLADMTSRPDKVVGTHFFSPAHIMKLLENVRGRQTSPETMATVMELGKNLQKVFIFPATSKS